ncbi:hypothetical protein BD779DRAFT_953011 [Infundibulicybe gibba]|nr:hypothetical protein BD779DRAFT_953011 [Infundibulicybe gibba]
MSDLASASHPSISLSIALHESSCAALCFSLWEWLITLDDEVEFIWSKPSGAWIKWAFIFARYFPLAVQMCGICISIAILHHSPMSTFALRGWYVSQVLVAAAAVTCVEVVMMARVYALYNRRRWIGLLLASLLLIETTIILIGVLITLPRNFCPGDLAAQIPASFIYFGISAIISQLTILGLSLFRYTRGQWSRAPVVSLMMRDGSFSFGVLSVFLLILIVYTIKNVPYAVAGYAWLMSAVSSIGCRSIINMQSLPAPNQTTALQFTTFMRSDEDSFTEDLPHNVSPGRSE